MKHNNVTPLFRGLTPIAARPLDAVTRVKEMLDIIKLPIDQFGAS